MSPTCKTHYPASLLSRCVQEEADTKLIQLKRSSTERCADWTSQFALCLLHAVQGKAKDSNRLLQGLILACCTTLTDLCGFQTWNRTAKNDLGRSTCGSSCSKQACSAGLPHGFKDLSWKSVPAFDESGKAAPAYTASIARTRKVDVPLQRIELMRCEAESDAHCLGHW